MDWNIFGVLGYLLIGIIMFVLICAGIFLIVSLILKMGHDITAETENEEEKKRNAQKATYSFIAIVILFLILWWSLNS